MDTNPCCPDSPLCPIPDEPVAREAWHWEQDRMERAWLDQHIRQYLAVPA